MKAFLKSLARRFNYDIMHLPTDPLMRQWQDLLHTNGIDLIFDVGANTGQYAQRIRALGYRGDIISFEPMAEAYQQLRKLSSADPNWQAIHTGVGHYNGKAVINVSSNSYSSSILKILPLHIESAPDAVYTRQEEISIQRLDSLIDQFYQPDKNLFVKVDTQGFERQVFEGSGKALDKIKGFQMELSLQPLYESEALMQEMIMLLRQQGYTLQLIESGYRNDKTGEIIQVDGYFFR